MLAGGLINSPHDLVMEGLDILPCIKEKLPHEFPQQWERILFFVFPFLLRLLYCDTSLREFCIYITSLPLSPSNSSLASPCILNIYSNVTPCPQNLFNNFY